MHVGLCGPWESPERILPAVEVERSLIQDLAAISRVVNHVGRLKKLLELIADISTQRRIPLDLLLGPAVPALTTIGRWLLEQSTISHTESDESKIQAVDRWLKEFHNIRDGIIATCATFRDDQF